MSTKYSISILLTLFLWGNISTSYGQQTESRNHYPMESLAKKIADLSATIAKEVSASVADIDVSELVRESEKVAHLSATEARKIAEEVEREMNELDFDGLSRDLAAIQIDIENLDFDLLGEQWGTVKSAAYQEEKVVEKTYRIDGKDRLSIDNRYGTIKVKNWDRNEFKVVVRIKVGESSERRTKEALDRVSISDSKVGNEVRFQTSIAAAESGWFSNLTGGSNQELSINYEVFMPARNELNLTNRYGAIETGDREGKLGVSVKYGSLKTGRLLANNNTVSADYSKVNIPYAREADISVNYGGLTLGEVGKTNISLNYSGSSTITTVNESADISLRYSGGFSLGLGSGIKQANISASYSSVSVSPARQAAFNFNTAVSYGSFSYGANATLTEANDRSNSKQYSGYWNKNSQNSVNIKARYGSVTLK